MAGRTERLPEDAVEYSLFPVVPAHLSEDEQYRYLSDCLNDYLGHLGGLLIDYVWQNDGFSLAPIVGKGSLPPHLSGSTNFGDNVEDEWFIAYLLFELTKAFPGVVATISDNDGEFLLIEAADALPKWLNPDTAEDRVYIYQGELHIVPIPQSPAEISQLPMFTPNKGEGAQCVRDHTSLTQAPPAIRKLLQKRLDSVPAKVAENVHHAHCYVPANLAAVLDQRPDLIGAAVRAFYYRDPIDLQACRTMKTFPAEDIVLARVRLTRCQYAQLLQQQFQPDKRSGWILPATSNPKFKCHDIGLKLAHGFEILCSRCQGSSNGSANGHHTSVDSDVRWKRFLKTLQKKGFFKGEIEGSQRYKELLKSAKKFFQDNIQQNNKSSEEPGVAVWDILQANNFSVEYYRKREATIPEEDDDSWLYLSPEGLEHLLESRMGAAEAARTEPVDTQQVASAMQAFVGGDAGFEGAEFPRDAEDGGDVEFDSTGFIHAMTKMFEFKDDEDEDSDMSEYDSGGDDDELGSPTKGGPKPDPQILELMAQMDRELARSKVGKSFELEKPKPKPKPPPRPAGKEESPKSQSTPSTPKHQASQGTPKSQSNQGTPKKEYKKDVDDEDDDFFRPVNIDVNVIKNSLESYSAQQGLPGPASNILQGMGIRLSGLADSGSSASPKPNSTPNPNQSPSHKPQRPPRPAHSPATAPKPNSNPNPKPSPFRKPNPNPSPKPSPSQKPNPKVETQI